MGACYGDAFLAGLAVGAIGGIEALKQDWVKKDKEIKLTPEKSHSMTSITQLFGELYAHSKEAIHQLADLQR